MDGIILQITGCKHWRVYDTPLAVRPLPDTVFKVTTRNLQPMTIAETDSDQQSGADEYVKNEKRWKTKDHIASRSQTLKPKVYEMAPGSLLYIPRGFAHEAATNCSGSSHLPDDLEESAPSLHVTFGLETATDTTVEIFIHHYIDILAKHHDIPTIARFSYEDQLERRNNSNSSRRIDTDILDSIHSNTITMKKQQDENYSNNTDNQSQSKNATILSDRNLKYFKERINYMGDIEVSADENEMITKDDKDADDYLYLTMNVTEISEKINGYKQDTSPAHSRGHFSTSNKPLSLSITLISSSSDSTVQMDDISLSDIFHLIVHIATTIDKDLNSCQDQSTTISSNSKHCEHLHDFMIYLKKNNKKEEKSQKSAKNNKKRKVTGKRIAEDSLELSASPSILRRAVAVTEYTAKYEYQPMIYNLIPSTIQYLKQFLSFYKLPDILLKTMILGLNTGQTSVNLGNIDFCNNTVKVNRARGITGNRNSKYTMLPGLNYVKYFLTSSSVVRISSGSDIPYVRGLKKSIQGKNQDEFVVQWFQNNLLQTCWDSVLVADSEQKEIDIFNQLELLLDNLQNEIGIGEMKSARGQNEDKSKNDLKILEIIDVKIRAVEDEEDSPVSHAYCAAWKEMTNRLDYKRSFRNRIN